MFRRLAVLMLSGSLAAFGFAQSLNSAAAPSTPAGPAAAAVLTDGTAIKLRVPKTAHIGGSHVGDQVELEVVQEIKIGDVTVISTTCVATAVVTAQHSPMSKTDTGKVDANLHSIALVDGQAVPLRTVRQKPQGLAADTGVSTGAWQDVVLTDGEEMTAYVAGTVPLDLIKLRLAGTQNGVLRVASIPVSGEISIDGKIVGITPYSAHVTRGEHVVSVKLAGYAPWRQTVNVAENAVEVQAQLTTQDATEIKAPAKAPAPSLGELARQARAKKAAAEPAKPADDAGGHSDGAKIAPVVWQN